MTEVAADAPRKRTSRWGLAAIEDTKPVSKRKRCRWSDIDPEAEKQANLHAAPAMGLPNERIRCARLQGRLNEITQVMTGGSLENIDLGRPRSPSPEPTYDAHGKRTNTRDQRLRDRYTREKQEIVVEISRINPDFDASAVGAVLTFKRTAKFPIPWREYPEYNFIGLIIGPRGTTQKRLEKETNTKIAIRGKGSVKDGKGRRDGVRDPSEDEDLHVLIEAYDDESLAAASKLVKDLLTPKDDETNEHKKQQLRELALMNGTLREEEYLTMVKGRVSNYGTPQIPGGDGQLPAGGTTAPWKPAMVPGGDASLPGDMPSRPGGFQDDIADRFLNEISGRGPSGGGGGGSTPWGGASAYGTPAAAGLSQRHVLAQPDAPDPECNCYIGGLPPHWNEEAVRANCIPFGEIKSIRIMRDKDTQMSKCYGFVTFARRDSAQLAIQNLNQLAVEGKFLQMRLANVKGPDGATTVNPNMQRSQAAPWQQQGYQQGGYQQPHGGHVFRPPQFSAPPQNVQNYGGYPQQQGYGMPMHGGYDGGNWQQQQQQQQQYWGGQQQHQGYGGYEEPPPPPPPED